MSCMIGRAGVHVVMALIYQECNDHLNVQKQVQLVQQLSVWALHVETRISCELLYGRIGYVYTALFLNQQMGEQVISVESIVKPVVKLIFSTGELLASSEFQNNEQFKAHPILLWFWYHSYYLGAAHGITGIIHVLLECPFVIQDAQQMNLLFETVKWVCSHEIDGNIPSDPESDEPLGMLLSLSKVLNSTTIILHYLQQQCNGVTVPQVSFPHCSSVPR